MSWQRFFQRAKRDHDLREEIENYIALETDENMARGMDRSEAIAAARRKLGNRTRVREDLYERNSVEIIETVSREVRHALRLMRRNPMFSLVAILTLALGIGANTAVFSVVESVLLRPLPYPESNRLIALRQLAPGAPGLANLEDGLLLSASMYETYADHNRVFESIGVWTRDVANVTGLEKPEQVRLVVASDGVLQALGIAPALGRWLNQSDQVPDGQRNIMLSYGYWQRQFGGSAAVLGRNLHLDGKTQQIVGVMPRGFRVVDSDFDLIVPAAFDRRTLKLAGFGFESVGRMKPGVTLGQVDTDLTRLLPVWMDSWSNGPGLDPHFYDQWKITPAVVPLKQKVLGNISNVLWVVMGTIGVVLLIACANVTNLLLIKTEGRQTELAVRAALGAGRGRLLRSLLLESVVLGLLAGLVASALAYEGLSLLVRMGPETLPRLSEIRLGIDGLLLTLASAITAAILCGLVAAWRSITPKIATGLRTGGRGRSESREQHRVRNVLVVGQVAMALLLLVSAGLMIRTLAALRDVSPGFADAEHLQTIRTTIPEGDVADPEQTTRIEQEITRKLSEIPGVRAVGFTDAMPMEGFGSDWDQLLVEGKTVNANVWPLRMFRYVSPGYFHTAGTRLLAGQDLSWQDVYAYRPVTVISENLAKELWGSPTAAIGKRVRRFEGMPWSEVIGVVENTRDNGVDREAPETAYWPVLGRFRYGAGGNFATRSVTFALRTDRAGSRRLVTDAEQAIHSVEANLPVATARTMQEVYDRSLSRTSFTLVILSIAAAMALVLGLIGIYGMISYGVSQRRREIGIRLALGAQQREVQMAFVRSGITLTVCGLAIGLTGSLIVTRFMRSLLFGVSPMDPTTYLLVPIVLLAAAMLASYLPARRTASVDPAEALRAE